MVNSIQATYFDPKVLPIEILDAIIKDSINVNAASCGVKFGLQKTWSCIRQLSKDFNAYTKTERMVNFFGKSFVYYDDHRIKRYVSAQTYQNFPRALDQISNRYLYFPDTANCRTFMMPNTMSGVPWERLENQSGRSLRTEYVRIVYYHRYGSIFAEDLLRVHDAAIRSLVVDLETNKLITGADDGTMTVVDLSDTMNQNLWVSLNGHQNPVQNLAVHKKMLFSISGDLKTKHRKICAHDLTTNNLVASHQLSMYQIPNIVVDRTRVVFDLTHNKAVAYELSDTWLDPQIIPEEVFLEIIICAVSRPFPTKKTWLNTRLVSKNFCKHTKSLQAVAWLSKEFGYAKFSRIKLYAISFFCKNVPRLIPRKCISERKFQYDHRTRRSCYVFENIIHVEDEHLVFDRTGKVNVSHFNPLNEQITDCYTIFKNTCISSLLLYNNKLITGADNGKIKVIDFDEDSSIAFYGHVDPIEMLVMITEKIVCSISTKIEKKSRKIVAWNLEKNICVATNKQHMDCIPFIDVKRMRVVFDPEHLRAAFFERIDAFC